MTRTIKLLATRHAASVVGVATLVLLALATTVLTSTLRTQTATHAAVQRPASQQTANADVAGDCYYDPISGQEYCDNYTPPVWDPGTGGWTN